MPPGPDDHFQPWFVDQHELIDAWMRGRPSPRKFRRARHRRRRGLLSWLRREGA